MLKIPEQRRKEKGAPWGSLASEPSHENETRKDTTLVNYRIISLMQTYIETVTDKLLFFVTDKILAIN